MLLCYFHYDGAFPTTAFDFLNLRLGMIVLGRPHLLQFKETSSLPIPSTDLKTYNLAFLTPRRLNCNRIHETVRVVDDVTCSGEEAKESIGEHSNLATYFVDAAYGSTELVTKENALKCCRSIFNSSLRYESAA